METRPSALASTNAIRCICGADLGPGDKDWKARAHQRTVPPHGCGPFVTLHADIELREFAKSAFKSLILLAGAPEGIRTPAASLDDKSPLDENYEIYSQEQIV
jgi:hypothetical protein